MESLVPPALAASAPERARAVQALLDAHGPEMDRRRELTPEVVDALAGQDLLRMLLPKSMGGQETPLVEYCKACEAIAWADASSAWFVNQSNVSAASSAAAMPHEAAAAIFAGSRAGLAWGARHNNSSAVRVEGGYVTAYDHNACACSSCSARRSASSLVRTSVALMRVYRGTCR